MTALRDVLIPAGHGAPSTPACAALPPGAKRGAVVIHELFGRTPEIERVVVRLAGSGYAAVAPDLFARGMFACLKDTFRAMRTGSGVAVEQGRNARAWLCEEAGIAQHTVGLIGFCFWRAAMRSRPGRDGEPCRRTTAQCPGRKRCEESARSSGATGPETRRCYEVRVSCVSDSPPSAPTRPRSTSSMQVTRF